jgi:hypothetical protein
LCGCWEQGLELDYQSCTCVEVDREEACRGGRHEAGPYASGSLDCAAFMQELAQREDQSACGD